MRYIVLSALLLAGCAGMTPSEVREQGTAHTAHVGADAEASARCIQRKAERQSDQLLADVRPLPDGREVIVRVIDAGEWIRTGAVAVIDITPSPYLKGQNLARGWVNPSEPADHSKVFFGLVNGC